MNTIPRFKLTSDYSVSRVIKGGWQLAGGHGRINKREAIEDMFKYVENGITTFDFADIYTGVEELTGVFIKQVRRRYGSTRLDDIQLHSKFVPDLSILRSISKKLVEQSIDRTLNRLGVERIDLIQFHWWDFEVPKYIEVASHLYELQQKGKIKHLGVTNFDTEHLSQIISAGIPIVTNQVQYSVIDKRPEHAMIDFCKKNGIALLCYGTLAGGFFSERYLEVPEDQISLTNRSLVKYKLVIDEFSNWKDFQNALAVLKKIGKRYNATVSQIASRYILDKPQVAGVIIGGRNIKHLSSYSKIFDFTLSYEDRRVVDRLYGKFSDALNEIYSFERIKDGPHAKIMKYNLNSEK